ncbi:MAG: hypothetical protein WDN69_01965 [Aliidongia sp.]
MEQVEERLALAPPASRTALISALLPSDIFVQGYFNDKNMRPAMRARGRAIERLMTLEGARLDQLVVRRPSRRRPRVGFITIGVQDRAESVFLLSHMEHLGRLGFDVRLYCRMIPTAGSAACAATPRRAMSACPMAFSRPQTICAARISTSRFSPAISRPSSVPDNVCIAAHRPDPGYGDLDAADLGPAQRRCHDLQ